MLSCLALLCITAPSFGLAAVRPGVEIGANLSSLRYDDVPDYLADLWHRRWKTSVTGGASLQIPLRGRLALATGLRYVQQGNRVQYDTFVPGFGRVVGEFRVLQDYLAVPALLECRPLPSRRFFFTLGPEIGFLVSARIVTEQTLFSGGPPLTSSETRSITSDLDRTNLSLNGGMGLEFPMGVHVGVTSLRYSRGLTGVTRPNAWVTDWKTHGVEWSVGMRW
jgi:hypothetical protein